MDDKRTKFDDGGLKTYSWAAKYLGLSVRTLQGLVKRGLIPHKKIGRLVRFHPQVLDRWGRDSMDKPDFSGTGG